MASVREIDLGTVRPGLEVADKLEKGSMEPMEPAPQWTNCTQQHPKTCQQYLSSSDAIVPDLSVV